VNLKASSAFLYYNSIMPSGLLPALRKSARVTLPVLWRAARQLFHEMAGALFALFAVFGAMSAWRQWRNHPVPWVIGIALVYAAMMAAFSYLAFRSARRIR
jgi:hypothetical protein